jgi:CobQ-like glutamine amidotransferase family enzyme
MRRLGSQPCGSPVSEVHARIVVVYPDLLGTYGDRGNAVVLAWALRRAGIAAEVIDARSDEPLPRNGAIYVIGGGEDAPQVLAARTLVRDGGLEEVVARGVPVLAVCAGLQILGRRFVAEGSEHRGLGLVPAWSERGAHRAVGEVLVAPLVSAGPYASGFENHHGITILEAGAQPFARVISGQGNGVGGVDGVVAGPVVGTYLHGPVLARNPELARWLIERAGLAWVEPAERWRALGTERVRAALRMRRSGSRQLHHLFG